MKTIVTHLNPDLDAICSVWLILRFLPGWEDAEVKFVPAGLSGNRKQTTVNSKQRTENKETDELWVDTGFGELDHHQTSKRTCASKLVLEYISKQKTDNRKQLTEEEKKALERLVNVVLRIDYDAQDITLPNASDDFYSFLFNERQILRGIRTLFRGQSDKHLEYGLITLDAVYEVLKAKISAEEIIKNALKFKTEWGKGLGAVTNNEMYMHLAQENGYQVVVAKDPKRGHIRIHALPGKKIDFTNAYNKLKKMDPQATWFLHSSKSLLLNGSSANPEMKPTKLTLEEVIKVLTQM